MVTVEMHRNLIARNLKTKLSCKYRTVQYVFFVLRKC